MLVDCPEIDKAMVFPRILDRLSDEVLRIYNDLAGFYEHAKDGAT